MKVYNDLISRVLDNGTHTEDRTGVGTWSVFGESIKFNLQDSFPIVTSRKIDYTQAIAELCGFLQCATTKEEFTALGCHYWNSTNGMVNDNDLGPIYGAQWHNFNGINQLQELELALDNNPTSRRLILSTWNPADIHKMCLPPCHITAQFEVKSGYLSCIVYMRSVDVCLGLPYDIVVYAALVNLLARRHNLKPGGLMFAFGNCHIYMNHLMKALKMIKEPVVDSTAVLRLINVSGSLTEIMPSTFDITGYSHSINKYKFELNL